MSKQTKQQNRRYYLHQKIKSLVRYNARGKAIYLNHQESPSPDMLELQKKFNYQIQYEL